MEILIAEDEAFSRLLLQRTLPQWGFEVETVENGCDALESLLRNDGPNIAILDWLLPELNGIEICQMIRARQDLPFRYLMMLTAKDTQANRVQALTCGADIFMTKPYDLAVLRAYLQVAQRQVNYQRRHWR